MTTVTRSLRLQSNQSISLNRSTGQPGEIFYDATNKTLRIYDGRVPSGSILATQTWVTANTTQLPAQASHSGKYLTTNGTSLSWATVTIPAQVQPDWNSTSGLGQILNKPSIPSLTGYATESYVTTAISGISIPSLTGYAQLSGAAFTGTITLQQSTEVLNTKTGATGTVTHDFSTGAIWYHTSMAANFVVNFTNVPTTNNRTISTALVLVQGATARLPIDLSIDGVAQTIKWLTIPTGSANKIDLVSFTLIRTNSAWTVLGSLSTYG
jgi:hypothetical protein